MPFYQCITLAGTLTQDQKEEIASEISGWAAEATVDAPDLRPSSVRGGEAW